MAPPASTDRFPAVSSTGRVWECQGKYLDLSRPGVMGILNITPDSFSDGGFFLSAQKALDQGRRLAEEGAAIIDVGGESTRPGARPVSVEEELDRVIPVIETLARELPIPLSIDSSKPAVMAAAVRAGAGLINDVNALRADEALAVAAELQVPVCLMHMQGEPRTMQHNPSYVDVVDEVGQFLAGRIAACVAAGIDRQRILIDPGFGFGKTPRHNLTLIKHLADFADLECPILVGVSRKSTIGAILDRPVEQRLAGSLALTTLAVVQGAALVRTHDVAATVDVLRMLRAVEDV